MIDQFQGDVTGEIKAKVDHWDSRMKSQLGRFNTYADYWRLVRPPMPGDFSGFANPQVTETTRATEAIATFIYRAMTSASPNFQLLSRNPYVSPEALWQSESVIEWQKTALQYNRRLLRACRSAALMGTVPVEQPWIVNMPYYEGTDFVPRSLLQLAFDPMAFDIASSGWHATIDFVTKEQLTSLAQRMPEVYDPEAVMRAIDSNKGEGKLTPEVTARLAAAGYYNYGGGHDKFNSNVYYMVTYYGPLQDNATPNGRDWCVSVVNDSYIVRGHESEYPRRPFEFAHLNEFELESYGYGVGRVAEALQPEINSNRGRMHDTITFSLFNMWIASRMSNIKTTQLRVRPWGVVEVEGDAEGLKAIRPQLEGVNFGVKLEELMKSEFRATTGATDNLQAIVTEATATESSIAQSEAVRRLSVIAENMAEPLLRRHISKMHENNCRFLDQPFWIANTGESKQPVRVFPSNLAEDVDVAIKVITDKDFRPQRNKDILSFLQIVTSIRNDHPEIGKINIMPFVEELARGIGINPRNAFQSAGVAPGGLPQGPQQGRTAMDQLGNNMARAESIRSNAGELGAMAHQSATQELANAV